LDRRNAARVSVLRFAWPFTGTTGAVAALPKDLPSLDVRPGPRLAEPLPAGRPVRWGILATGNIARGFARNLNLLPEATIAAVASRRLDSAQAFAKEYGAAAAYGSYEELVADPAVDIVYVATPHALHKENTLMAFAAGKPVLCEKALTLNARDAEELVAAARDKGLFFMEAMWMRCNPLIRRLRQLAAGGHIGRIEQVRADLGFLVDRPPTDRLLAPELGGGALLDMGVYPLTFAYLFLGEPSQVEAVATLAPSGIDLNLSLSLGYDSGAVASLSSTMTAWSPRTASIATDLGRFDLPEAFHHPTTATWTSAGESEQISAEVIGTGLANEALEVIRCLRSGETESPLVPLDETVALMRLMDRIREKIGLVYATDASAEV
jgi:predicted dehydrogenase